MFSSLLTWSQCYLLLLKALEHCNFIIVLVGMCALMRGIDVAITLL